MCGLSIIESVESTMIDFIVSAGNFVGIPIYSLRPHY